MKGTISERLKFYRKQKSYSIREVAEKLNISQSTYRSWENGVNISGEPYVKLAEIFEVGLHELITGEVSDSLHLISEIERKLMQLKQKL
jgi:transcriptional regulator with XRE-family HTH domain